MRSVIRQGVSIRPALFGFLAIGVMWLGANFIGAGHAAGAANLRFEFSFPDSVRQTAADGRLFAIIARAESPEPRFQIRSYDSTPFFGQNVDGLNPGQIAVVDDNAYGYP